MRRVVVTGVGAITPCGADTTSTWRCVMEGASGIRRIQSFDPTEHACQIAGECLDFDPTLWTERRKLRAGARFVHMALGAAHMAVGSAGFAPNDEEKERVGTYVGVGLCGLELMESQHRVLLEKGPRKISPYFIAAGISNLAPGEISIRFGFRGPSYTTASACSSSAHAIGEAFRAIRFGVLDAALAGGSEACITSLGVAGFTALRALSTRNDEPEKASRPFDRGRDGFVMSEGAAALVLEERDRAIARGAPILAEIVGYGATCDAYHVTQPAREAEGAQRAMKLALAEARIDVERVDYINAHATSTPLGDTEELRAIKRVLGPHAISASISATKSVTGHLLGAAGALESVLTVLAIHERVVPPTVNLDDPEEDATGLSLVAHQARSRTIDVALSNSFGFGGTNVALAFARH